MKITPRLRLFLLSFNLLAASQGIAQTWNGSTDTLWDTDSNWSGTPPASSGSSALIFNPLNGILNLSTFNDLTSFTASSIDFDNSTTAGAYTLAGNQITLGGNITTTGSTGTPSHTISLPTILSGNRTITTALNNNLSFSGIISQDIAGRSLTKAGAGTLTLSGNNSYSGGTNIDAGTVVVNTGGTLGATTGALNMGTGTNLALGTVGNLTLNTNAQVGVMTVKSNTATVTGADIGQLSIASGSTLTASSFIAGVTGTPADNTNVRTALGTSGGGTLTITGVTTIGLTGPNGGGTAQTVVDLSGLHTFNLNASSQDLRIGSAGNSKAAFALASNTNNLNYKILWVGDTGNANYSSAGFSELKLGAGTNNLRGSNIVLGHGKGAGRLSFAETTGTVSITGAGGIGTAKIELGKHTTTVNYQGQENQLLLAGHSATVSASDVDITLKTSTGGGNVSSAVTFDTGTFSANQIRMNVVSANSTAGTLTSTFTVGGDSANSAATGIVNVVNNLLLAAQTNGTNAASGTLTINGGTVNVNTGAVATQGIRDTSTTTNATTTLTLQGGKLNLNGGVIGGNNSSGNRAIDNLNFRSGELQNVLQINGGAGLTKTTDSTLSGGTLILSGTNSYTGATAVNAGTLLINGSTASGSAINVAALATLGGNGTVGGATTFTGASIHAPGSAAATVGTQTFSSTVAYDTGTIFNWDLNTADGGNLTDPGVVADAVTGTYDRVTATGAITATGSGDAVFKVVLAAGDSFTDAFWNSNKSWTNIFTGGSGSATNLEALFTGFEASGGIDVTGLVAGRGQFTLSSTANTLNWTAVPEPTSALAGLLLGAGLLRRRRQS